MPNTLSPVFKKQLMKKHPFLCGKYVTPSWRKILFEDIADEITRAREDERNLMGKFFQGEAKKVREKYQFEEWSSSEIATKLEFYAQQLLTQPKEEGA